MALSSALAMAGMAIGGEILSAKSQKKAAKRASGIAQDTAAQNNALARWMYGQNAGVLSPYQQRGNAAGNAMNALLGLGVPSNNAGTGFIDGYAANDAGMMPQGSPMGMMPQDDMAMFNDGMSINGAPTAMGDFGQGYLPATAPTAQGAPQTGMAQAGQPNALSQYQDAFNNYRNSTGYQFRLNEGQRALGSNFAARGLSNSGAAARSLSGFNQNMASGEFGNYMNQLAGIQNMGLGAGSAQAGVGQNFVNTVSANNNSAGTAAANAALLRGNATAGMWGGIAGGIGNIFGSSFGR
ncbi:hypothetical protein UFOVP319_34 [uncultured Caudovirales phage]|uniref:DNA transfer protein n=1 Tax=uncultured Caudovirales phage TaxID=2100421 RepID=A0A6J5LSL9_9CAUD|nr:hypothetical protein UFOVP319_34 [uncultured Caudovirales phage]